MMTKEWHNSENRTKTSAITTKSNPDKSRKRKRSYGDSLTTAYSTVKFATREVPSKCRPDSPHFFFSSSYSVVDWNLNSVKKEREVAEFESVADVQQVVHKHVNGLCMVTVGDLSIPASKILKCVRFVAEEAPSCSNAEKRKRQSKMLKGRGKVNHVVSPSTVIAELVLEDRKIEEEQMNLKTTKETIIPLRACVWGTIIELNNAILTPDMLLQDPLLDGFLAIILPTGPFPPENATMRAIRANGSKIQACDERS